MLTPLAISSISRFTILSDSQPLSEFNSVASCRENFGSCKIFSINSSFSSRKKAVTLRSNLINQSMETKTERKKLNRIKAVLAETGHTGKWLAEQLGKDPVTVSKWCTNTSQPDLYTLHEVANVLETNIKDLIYS